MNFNNPEVRARVVEHIQFATAAAEAAFPEDKSSPEEVRALRSSLRIPIILQLLSFTLNLDFRLRNSLEPAMDLAPPEVAEEGNPKC